MKRNLTVIWGAILAAGATVVGVLTGRRRRRRAERQRAREERRAKRAQRKAQGTRKGGATGTRTSTRSSDAGRVTTGATAAAASGASRSADAETTDGSGPGDDLQAIRGLGAVAAGKLRDAGVTSYAQIAAWTPEEAHEIAVRLELQPGRIVSDDWIGQARRLVEEAGKGA